MHARHIQIKLWTQAICFSTPEMRVIRGALQHR